MKKIFYILFLFLIAGNIYAQTGSSGGQMLNPVPPNQEFWTRQGATNTQVVIPFDNNDEYYSHKSVTKTDVLTDGIIDTLLDAGYTFYGKIWSTSQSDGFPRVTINGRDSADITVYYRWVSWTANVTSFGVWTAYGIPVGVKIPRTNRDSLYQIAGKPAWEAGAGTDTTGYIHNETGWIQFKYYVVPTNAAATYRGGTKNKNCKSNAKTEYTFMGEMDITFRHKER